MARGGELPVHILGKKLVLAVKRQRKLAQPPLFVFQHTQFAVVRRRVLVRIEIQRQHCVRVLLDLAGFAQVGQRGRGVRAAGRGAGKLAERHNQDAVLLRHRVQVERNIGHLLEPVAPAPAQLLQVVDEHDPLPPRQRGGQDILHAPARRMDQLQIGRGDLLFPRRRPLPFLVGHFAPVDARKIDDAAVRHQAVGQLCGAGLQTVKADPLLLPHVRRHLQRQRGFARRGPPRQHHKIPVIRVQPPVQLVQPVADKFPLFPLLGEKLQQRLVHRHDPRPVFLAEYFARLPDQLARLRACPHPCKLLCERPQPPHPRLLLHSGYIRFPAERRRRDIHALQQQVVILRAADAANGYRVHRPSRRKQPHRRLIHRAQLGDAEILRPCQADQLAHDRRVHQQAADHAVFRVKRCLFYHCSYPPF